jgi:hypothetical protein
MHPTALFLLAMAIFMSVVWQSEFRMEKTVVIDICSRRGEKSPYQELYRLLPLPSSIPLNLSAPFNAANYASAYLSFIATVRENIISLDKSSNVVQESFMDIVRNGSRISNLLDR